MFDAGYDLNDNSPVIFSGRDKGDDYVLAKVKTFFDG